MLQILQNLRFFAKTDEKRQDINIGNGNQRAVVKSILFA